MTRFPQGQVVAEYAPAGSTNATVAGVHFTLRLMFKDFHIDDSWDVLTANDTFSDDNPEGHTLYGADIMVSPDHQHHGLAHALTDAARAIVTDEALWRMVGGSRLPGYGAVAARMSAEEYVAADRPRTDCTSQGWLGSGAPHPGLPATRSRQRRLGRGDPVGEPRMSAAA
jgi:GNAT superfamily N-acetyltransferase